MSKHRKQLEIGSPRVYIDWLTIQFPGHWFRGKEFQQFRYGIVQILKRGPVGRLVLRDIWLKQFQTPGEAVLCALFYITWAGVFEWGPSVALLTKWEELRSGRVLWEDCLDHIGTHLDLVELVISADAPGIPYAGEFEIAKAFRMSRKTTFFSRKDFKEYRRQADSARCGEARGGQASFFAVYVVPPGRSPEGSGFKVKVNFSGKYRNALHLSSLRWKHADLIDSVVPTARSILARLNVHGAWTPNPLVLCVPGSPLPLFLRDLGFFGC